MKVTFSLLEGTCFRCDVVHNWGSQYCHKPVTTLHMLLPCHWTSVIRYKFSNVKFYLDIHFP
jgi:hypothetical protein